jgi:hypothetical protein
MLREDLIMRPVIQVGKAAQLPRSVQAAGVVLAIIGAMAVPASGAWDDADPEPPYGARLMSPEEAFAQDSATLARQLGVPVEVMAERLRFQVGVDAVRQEWPASIFEESYAGGAMVHSGTAPGAVLYFKGEVPAFVRSQVAAWGSDGVQLVGGQRYTQAELQDRQRMVLETGGGTGVPARPSVTRPAHPDHRGNDRGCRGWNRPAADRPGS